MKAMNKEIQAKRLAVLRAARRMRPQRPKFPSREMIVHATHAEIPVGENSWAAVSLADATEISKYPWTLVVAPNTNYAICNCKNLGIPAPIAMHRLIMGNPYGLQIDHWDGDGLNNRRENLRVATEQENTWNQVRLRNSKFPYKGVRSRVRKHKDGTTYTVYFAVLIKSGWTYRSGFCKTPEDAAAEYDKLARKHFGKFASLNFDAPYMDGKNG